MLQNPNNPTCIDLILSNTHRSFQSTCVILTGPSDFHLMALIVMKKSFRKFHPNPPPPPPTLSSTHLSIVGPTKTSQMNPLGSGY